MRPPGSQGAARSEQNGGAPFSANPCLGVPLEKAKRKHHPCIKPLRIIGGAHVLSGPFAYNKFLEARFVKGICRFTHRGGPPKCNLKIFEALEPSNLLAEPKLWACCDREFQSFHLQLMEPLTCWANVKFPTGWQTS